MENVSNCFTEAAQCATNLFELVIGSVSSRLWPDQNNQTDEEEQNFGPPPSPNAGRHTAIQVALLITQGKEVGSWVTTISAGAIFSLSGNKEAMLLHEYTYSASIVLNFLSFVSGLILLLLVRKNPEMTLGFVKIARFTIYFSQGTFVYAICFAVCYMLLLPSKFVVVFILVVPPFPFGLIATLSSVRSGSISIP